MKVSVIGAGLAGCEASVIGAGLAGCEAAWQLARRGIEVDLYEMKPQKYTPAHHYEGFAELICSNSLKAARFDSAAGLLKAEMTRLHSLVMESARQCSVPAGGALAVDRTLFSDYITSRITGHELIHVIHREVTELPQGMVIVAAGPLMSDGLAGTVQSLVDEEQAPLKEIDRRDFKVYEGCMPVEVMAKRGPDTLRYGPLKPVGLTDPRTGHRPWAVVQLRKENAVSTMYNLVGFQTNLKWGEQKRVFSMIPGLEQAEFLRYGVMHRNTFLNSPKLLDCHFRLKKQPDIFFAGQITGVEGYTESASSGIIAGLNAGRILEGKEPVKFPAESMMGALSHYISDETVVNFQPMGANMGVLPPLEERIRDKKLRYQTIAERGMKAFEAVLETYGE